MYSISTRYLPEENGLEPCAFKKRLLNLHTYGIKGFFYFLKFLLNRLSANERTLDIFVPQIILEKYIHLNSRWQECIHPNFSK